MNKVYSLFLGLMICLGSQAQAQLEAFDSTINYHRERLTSSTDVLEISVNGMFASNFLDKDLLVNNFWSTEIIQNQINRLKTANFGGLEAEAGFDYITSGSKNKTETRQSLWIGGKHQARLGLRFNQDLIRLILEGNAENHVIDLNTGVNSIQFIQASQIYGGVSRTSGSSKFNVALGFIAGHNMSQYTIKQGRLITDSNGESVDAEDVDFLFERSRGNNIKGVGAISHFEYLNESKPGEVWSISLHDLGFINWSKVDVIKPLNKSFSYDGFDLTGFWENDFSPNFEDSIRGNYIVEQQISKVKLYPFKLQAKLVHQLSNGDFLSASLQYKYFTGYIPKLSILYGQYFGKNNGRWSIGADVGGFGLAALKFETDIKLSNNSGIRLGLSGVESLLSPNLPVYWTANTSLYFGF